jgi:hypothetical protein
MICTPRQYFPGDKIKKNKMSGNLACMGEGRGLYSVLVENPDGKRPLWIPRRRWENNVKTIFRVWDVSAWTESSWLRIGAGGGHL